MVSVKRGVTLLTDSKKPLKSINRGTPVLTETIQNIVSQGNEGFKSVKMGGCIAKKCEVPERKRCKAGRNRKNAYREINRENSFNILFNTMIYLIINSY